jgi:hypothetical protein
MYSDLPKLELLQEQAASYLAAGFITEYEVVMDEIESGAYQFDGLDVLDEEDYDLLQNAWLEQLGVTS